MMMLLVLSAVMLSTMFLPAYQINSETMEKGLENAQTKDEDKDEEKDEEDNKKDKKKEDTKDGNIDTYVKKFKEKIKEEKKKDGTDNESISVLKLMTKSLSDIRYNGKRSDNAAKAEMGKKNYDALNKKHLMTKVFLWMVYGILLAVILVILLGYCLKWNKYIPLSVSAVYGVFAAVAFAVLRFGTITSVKKEVGTLTEKFVFPGGKNKFVNIDNAEIASSFLGYAFLVGLIAAAAILIISVISMFVGNRMEIGYVDGIDSDLEDEWNDWGPTVFQPKPEPGTEHSGEVQGSGSFDGDFGKPADLGTQPQPQPQPQIQPQPQPVSPVPPVQAPPRKPTVQGGRVRCTKGTTSGSAGYALPQDRKVIVGKSPQKANLVIVNNTHISNIHCTIRYNPQTKMYTVRDHSTNGTFVNGVRLKKETSVEYPAGTVLSLADGKAEITLG